jgi:hypothetical protein
MVRKDHMFGFALWLMASAQHVSASDDSRVVHAPPSAPMEIPHVTKVALDAKAAKKCTSTLERSLLLNSSHGLSPLPFPKNTDVRQRILTTEVRNTPLVGWLAENLYRDKKDAGWCLEADPGQSEYVVFYRWNLK